MSSPSSLRIARIKHTTYNRDVYEPSDDSFALVDALRDCHREWMAPRPLQVLEIGCGSGYVICSVVLMLQDLGIDCACVATDVSQHALEATAATLAAHGVRDRVDLVRTDLQTAFSPRMTRGVDLLIFNPPYVVTPDEEVTTEGIAAAWAGGADGRVVIDRLLAILDQVLSPTGRMYMITVHDNKPLEIIEHMRKRHGLHGEIVLVRRADEELIKVVRLCRTDPSDL